VEHTCNDVDPTSVAVCPGCLEEKSLRAIANEAWSNAATVDGLMRFLGPLIDSVAIENHDLGYEQGQRDAFGGLSEEEYQRRIITANYSQGQRDERDRIRAAVKTLRTMDGDFKRAVLAVIDGEGSDE
jgi:hypothetical protein